MHNKQAIMQRTAAARNYFKQLQGDKYTRCWTDKNSNGVRSVKAECLYYNTKEEAVRCNKQIIILPNKRNFVDGIDDIETCIKYHTGIDDEIYDNSQCSINKFDFDKYYDYVIDKKFQIDDNYFNNNYNTFNEWIINNNLIKKED
jgi:hypothetical protein